ncbi:glycoside hydrolase family 16 protein [Sphingomonas sp. BGYR3]|uniref:glycoside hydrolase family 16 protein n=1 Tax=Sphingomonas sp. BGYR3 TaxID=2975483 RepID=UPI0021A4A506|nr:glycoside hydrolase family 16 protein [Sphingomonas sp. BGYR3]MDG5489514.1 glycoside hydrolase family 16 protein [Sphingomonas sp. BGYR3]
MMVRAAALIALALAPAAAAAGEPLNGYVLAWSDEFDTPGLPDATRWTYDTHRNAQGWYNEEAQYYAASRPENARVEDGKLIIEAHKETLDNARFPDFGGQNYTSARLLSAPTDWLYGHVVTRAKLPCARGTWPAIWMLPVASDAGWPRGGEIDIMEHVGHTPGVIHGSVHTEAFNHIRNTHKTGTVNSADVCSAFHDYSVTWTPDTVEMAMDGQPYFRFDNDGKGDRATWPFDKPFRLILNIAIGGTWGGSKGIDDAAFPQRMEVEYVRYYRRPE